MTVNAGERRRQPQPCPNACCCFAFTLATVVAAMFALFILPLSISAAEAAGCGPPCQAKCRWALDDDISCVQKWDAIHKKCPGVRGLDRINRVDKNTRLQDIRCY